MGDIADMMLDGTLCEGCGVYLGSGNGYPQYCSGCRQHHPTDYDNEAKIVCPACGKRIWPSGLKQHAAAKHGGVLPIPRSEP